jgi:hypothetical protein
MENISRAYSCEKINLHIELIHLFPPNLLLALVMTNRHCSGVSLP